MLAENNMIEQLELENLQNRLNGSSSYRVATQETPIVCRIVCCETTTARIHIKKSKMLHQKKRKNKLCQRLDGAMRKPMGMI